MINQGECPKCGKRVLHVRIDNAVGTVDGETKGRVLTFSCIHCHVVLGVQLVVVRPRLNRRSDRVLAGEDAPRSRAHHAYIGLEVLKVLALLVTGIAALAG